MNVNYVFFFKIISQNPNQPYLFWLPHTKFLYKKTIIDMGVLRCVKEIDSNFSVSD